MLEDGGKHEAVGGKDILVLRGLSDFHDHLAFDGDQIVQVSFGFVCAPESELVPGCRLRRNRRLRVSILNLAVRQDQRPIIDIGKARCVGQIADPHGVARQGGDPQALGAVLEHNGPAGHVIGNGSMDPDSLRLILHMVARHDLAHGRNREGPRIGVGALQNLHVRERRDVKQYAGLLHFGVENPAGNSGDLNLGVQQAAEQARIAAFHYRVNVTPIGEHLQVGEARIPVHHRVGGADRGAHADEHAVEPAMEQIIECDGHGLGQGAMADQGHALADYDGMKAGLRRSPHQDAITGNQPGICGVEHKDGEAAFLDKQKAFTAGSVGHRRLEGDRQRVAGLGVAQAADRAQGGQR